ncbi:MAG TPA: hypothetical protein ENN07_04715 [candidate division Zixibacteria bacterium]|nr:hypothetical protein [candidate division Zixibacteria bacterium]
MTDEYKNIFWKLAPIVLSVFIALVGVVWGMTYAELSARVNRMDDIIMSQKEAIVRIESKLDIILEKNLYKTQNP